jgi:hypothetical protein
MGGTREEQFFASFNCKRRDGNDTDIVIVRAGVTTGLAGGKNKRQTGTILHSTVLSTANTFPAFSASLT